MVYDVRMGPQAVWHGDAIFIVCHATGGPDAALLGLEQAQRPFRALGSSGRAYLWIDGEWR